MSKEKIKSIGYFLARALAAVILLQTLFFKFTGHPDSVMLFSALGAEPVGRIGLGILELITAILLLVPSTAWIGAVLGIGMMLGAIVTHLGVIGIIFNNDGGALFTLAIVTLIASIITFLFNIPKYKKVLGIKAETTSVTSA